MHFVACDSAVSEHEAVTVEILNHRWRLCSVIIIKDFLSKTKLLKSIKYLLNVRFSKVLRTLPKNYNQELLYL